MNGTDEEMRAHFERAGLEHVRLLATTARFPNRQALALAWIAEKEREARKQHQAFQATQSKVATSTLRASRVAADAGIAAVVISAVTGFVALLSWLYPRH
jgi:hypothetical protein